MAQASDYPVTFAYGATDGVYYGPNGSIGPYHRGDDRAMPTGTPVIVNGVQIGLSGSTGASSGPHLHIGKWTSVDVNPQGRGFTFASATVHSTGFDSTNGNWVKVSAEGYIWVYLHLSRIDVSAGKVLTQGATTMGLDLGQARVLAHGVLGRNGFDGRPNALNGDCDADLNKNHVGKDAYAKIWEMYNSGEAVNFRNSTNGAYAERDRLRTDLSIMTQDRDGLIGKLDTANKTIADQTSTIGSLQQQVNDLTVKNTQLQTENDELNKKLASIGDAASNLSGLELIKLGLIKIWKDIGSK